MLREDKSSSHHVTAAEGSCTRSDDHGAGWPLLSTLETMEDGNELRVPTSWVQVWVMDTNAPMIAQREVHIADSFLEPSLRSQLWSPGLQSSTASQASLGEHRRLGTEWWGGLEEVWGGLGVVGMGQRHG